jgi:hypothetical protein
MVPGGYAGKINVNNALLPREFPAEFYSVLKVLRRTISREIGAGCRPIIAYFLSFAVARLCANIIQQWTAYVHSEIPIPNVQIPDVGLVGGTLDFMTASVIGEGPMSKFSTLPTSDFFQI